MWIETKYTTCTQVMKTIPTLSLSHKHNRKAAPLSNSICYCRNLFPIRAYQHRKNQLLLSLGQVFGNWGKGSKQHIDPRTPSRKATSNAVICQRIF
mmetsp:Transcript_1356/g.2698  ORF Transcript_1356/g.2698 Transcript_1356/m.2698 type:complete len:96 (-) Transcript_1356:284-571(-)